jgi:hypothetical protein
MASFSPVNVSGIIFIILTVIISLFIVIFASLYLLRKKKPEVVELEAIKVHELISLIISFMYFVTVVVTLILLIFQNRIISMQTSYALQSVEGSIYANITGQTLAADEIFIKYPEIRPYFYGGKDLTKDDPLYYRVKATAEYLLDFFDALETQLKKHPNLWIHEKKEWEANTVDMFAWSPMLCRYLEANKEWYSDELYALKKAGEQKRRQGFREQIFPQPAP